jgi:GNAT superfamily N-acetyltransferase
VELQTMTETPPPLHLATIQRSIDEACDVASHHKNAWMFRRAEASDFVAREDQKARSESFSARLGASLLFGVVATMDGQQYLSTFYLAFSTWDGRVLYLDRLATSISTLAVSAPPSDNFKLDRDSSEFVSANVYTGSAYSDSTTSGTGTIPSAAVTQPNPPARPPPPAYELRAIAPTSDSKSALTTTNGGESKAAGNTTLEVGQHHAELDPLVRYILGDIAIRLQCTRFTWQHYDYPQDLAGNVNVQPEYLKGWLTLHWDSDSMRKFAGEAPALDESSTIEEKMESCLKLQQNTDFRLRVAKPEDVDIIGRLVQGLADFEKEPDAVNVSVDQYRVDGFESRPLFYCFLMEDVSDKTAKPYACGMAFCFIGSKLGAGPFIYLEDLFIEEKYRGKGGGSLVMRSLAMLGQTLNCEKLVWQALDWNTPALTFYSKIGAKVQDGLLTSRYAGQNLKDSIDN